MMAAPSLTTGLIHIDNRGSLYHNNSFDMSTIKRSYIIENRIPGEERGWKGHHIENRWFTCIKGEIILKTARIAENILDFTTEKDYILDDKSYDILAVPKGYATNIVQLKKGSKVLVYADFFLNEVDDDYLRW